MHTNVTMVTFIKVQEGCKAKKQKIPTHHPQLWEQAYPSQLFNSAPPPAPLDFCTLHPSLCHVFRIILKQKVILTHKQSFYTLLSAHVPQFSFMFLSLASWHDHTCVCCMYLPYLLGPFFFLISPCAFKIWLGQMGKKKRVWPSLMDSTPIKRMSVHLKATGPCVRGCVVVGLHVGA